MVVVGLKPQPLPSMMPTITFVMRLIAQEHGSVRMKMVRSNLYVHKCVHGHNVQVNVQPSLNAKRPNQFNGGLFSLLLSPSSRLSF
jgi:hypothetical protein